MNRITETDVEYSALARLTLLTGRPRLMQFLRTTLLAGVMAKQARAPKLVYAE